MPLPSLQKQLNTCVIFRTHVCSEHMFKHAGVQNVTDCGHVHVICQAQCEHTNKTKSALNLFHFEQMPMCLVCFDMMTCLCSVVNILIFTGCQVLVYLHIHSC